MNRNYNKQNYGKFKRYNKIIRERIRPNAFGSIENKVVGGRIISVCSNKMIEKPMHRLNHKIVRKFYNPKKDSPYKGSLLYTISNLFTYGILALLVTCISIIIFK